jgi:hypothetical protein
MKTNEINIRDPYILVFNNKYYLYGTRSASCWGVAEGFDCYVSSDINEWEGPIEVFHNDGSFWADRNYWAPECYYYRNSFYFITTFGSETRKKGIQILKADSPLGPFKPISSGPVTPIDWCCIDGTLYFNKEKRPFLIFSRTFEDAPEGDMYSMELSEDLTEAIGIPKKIFSAIEAPWAVPFPFAKQEFNLDGDIYFSDGPYVNRVSENELFIIWSSWGQNGYTVGTAYSDNGEIDGNWIHLEKPLFNQNGGHGMVFKALDGQDYYLLHYPNDLYKERPQLNKIFEQDGKLAVQ